MTGLGSCTATEVIDLLATAEMYLLQGLKVT
jgi:hypothetical protein